MSRILLSIGTGFILVWLYLSGFSTKGAVELAPDPKTLYVDANTGGDSTGLDWTHAFTSLQDALAMAAYGDQIWVAAGIYFPDEGLWQINDAVSSTFQLVDGVSIYGGFDPHNGVIEFDERDWEAHITILSGDIDYETQPDYRDANGVVTTTNYINGSNAFHVLTSSGVSEATTLDGFTVTAGKDIRHWPDGVGAGMLNINDSHPNIRNTIFSANFAESGGGMGNIFDSIPTLTNLTFRRNRALIAGGGMMNFVGSLTATVKISDVTFLENSSYDDVNGGGGAMSNYLSKVEISDAIFFMNVGGFGGGIIDLGGILEINRAIFLGNGASENGGGIFCNTTSLTLTNVLLDGNLTVESGGGIYIESQNSQSDAPTLNHLTIVNNAAGTGGGLYFSNSHGYQITNSILWGNDADTGEQIYVEEDSTMVFKHSIIQDSGGSGVNWNLSIGQDGGGNLDFDPLFVHEPDDLYFSWITGFIWDDLHLLADSPAIDSADNATCPGIDLDGWPRPVNESCDMGAYEYVPQTYIPLIQNSTPRISLEPVKQP